MSYLNHEYSLNNSYALPPDSGESESDYLKMKLLETHSKLIQELQYSKNVEQQLRDVEYRQSNTMAENQTLVKKLNSLSLKSERDRGSSDRLRQMELNLVESQKKNDLLRVDLDSMRSKMLEFVNIKQQLQEERATHERVQSKLTDKMNLMGKEIKIKEMAQEDFRQESERYKQKYEKLAENSRGMEQELIEARRERELMGRQIEELEVTLRQERDKHNKSINQTLLLQKEAKDWRVKAETNTRELAQTRDELVSLKSRSKQEEHNLHNELERLTKDYNNMQSLYRQRENELQFARRKPFQEASQKKTNFEQTRELVGKLEKEEISKKAERVSMTGKGREKTSPRLQSENRASPRVQNNSRTYKEEKEDYLTMIESVTVMESQMLACNLERKKILAEMDRIDETKIKTKDMISRRRRLEVELQNQERKLEHIKSELKKMKVL